jgi:hypothetical protein
MTDMSDARPRSDTAIAELDGLARLLDSRWRIPGTSIRLGVDALAGLLPIVGDAAAGLVSAYIVIRAKDYGASRGVLARMFANVVLDTAVGSVPVIGTIFDVFYKSNNRNINMLREYLLEVDEQKAAHLREAPRRRERR